MRDNDKEQSKERSAIPDVDIIDLEKSNDLLPEDMAEEEYPEEEASEKDSKGRGIHFYMHIALLVVVLLVVFTVGYRLKHWGNFISQEDIFKDGAGVEASTDVLDEIFMVEDENGNILPPDHDGNGLTILALGNAPLADDAGSENSLASMIEELTGGTVINCAVNGSYMAAECAYWDAEEAPMDAYTPYWLCSLILYDDMDPFYINLKETMQDDFPPEGDYVFETLSNLDLNTIDILLLMYDATDYLMNHPMYNDENFTDIQQFTGNLEAACAMIQVNYPQLRIIVMSPTYAFAVDDNGEYVSSDVKRFDHDVLSTYVIREGYSCNFRRVTFVDNLYGTITEDNAPEYLTDNIHLNVEGRRLVAERFVYALNYYEP